MIDAVRSNPVLGATAVAGRQPLAAKNATIVPTKQDKIAFGQQKVSAQDRQRILLERAYEQLRGVVGQAKAELGIPEDAVLDTSPEATADRIADFALGFFAQYAENNGLEDDEAGRAQYAEFIGKAVAQGIEEARGILGALNALNGDVTGNIDKTQELIQSRFDDFVSNGYRQSV